MGLGSGWNGHGEEGVLYAPREGVFVRHAELLVELRDALLDEVVLEGDGDVEGLAAGLRVARRAVVVVVGSGAEGERRALEEACCCRQGGVRVRVRAKHGVRVRVRARVKVRGRCYG